ncbi:MAG: hypothetical protein OXH85_02470 [Truepera sp.]|nr:hypothetical protein [Truepera sp.]
MGDEERIQDVGRFVVEYDNALKHLACLNRKVDQHIESLKVATLLLSGDLEGELLGQGFRIQGYKDSEPNLRKYMGAEPWPYPSKETIIDLLAERAEAQACVSRLEGQRNTLGLSVQLQPPV